MKSEDIEKVRRLIENIDYIIREYEKVSSLLHYAVTYSEVDDKPIVRTSISGCGVTVPLDEYLSIVKSALNILTKKKENLIEELENV